MNTTDEVVRRGLCSGCGVCAGVCPAGCLEMRMVKGKYLPYAVGKCSSCGVCLAVCPFYEHELLRDDMAKGLFGRPQRAGHREAVGYYLCSYIGYSLVADQRERGASGGMATWLLERLLETNQVDRIIAVAATSGRDEPLFSYQTCADAGEVRAAAGSKYYPVEISRALRAAWRDPEDHRYAVVGLPCVLQGVRRAMRRNTRLSSRLPFLVGIVCNHCPGSYYTELLCGLAGVRRADVSTVAYRLKGIKRANHYRFQATVRDGSRSRSVGFDGMPSRVWNRQFFAYDSCSYCDDIFAELADVACMDAWLGEYLAETRGTSIVLVRNAAVQEVLESGRRDGLCELEPCRIETVIASQKNQVKRKKESIRHRMSLRTRAGGWLPRMHVVASQEANRRELRLARQEALVVRLSDRLWPLFRRLPAGLYAFFWTVSVLSGSRSGLVADTPRARLVRMLRALGLYAVLVRARNRVVSWRRRRLLRRAFRGAEKLGRVRQSARPDSPLGAVLFLPPSSPGSLGDEAIETAFVAALRARGAGEISVVSYSARDDRRHLGLISSPFTWRDHLRALGTLKRYDRFYVLGTDVLDGAYSEDRTLNRLVWASLAAAAGLRTAVVNFSFGEKPAESAVRAFRNLPPSVRLVSRDPVSRARLQERLRRHVELSADIAFLLAEGPESPTVATTRLFVGRQRQEGRILVGININAQVLGRNVGSSAVDRLVNAYVDAMIRLSHQGENRYAFVFLPHDFRGATSDLCLSSNIIDRLSDDVRRHSLLPATPYRAVEVKAICRGLDVILSGRMHVAILGLSQRIPVVSIGYQGKFEGLYKHFELPDLSVSADAALEPQGLFTSLAQMIYAREALGRQIEEKLPSIRRLAENNVSSAGLPEQSSGSRSNETQMR